ncbi:MFS domain-containing protein [Mycena indigotica]|uniref:MFS domain-containing protein n=1 Tax=Mycena indigotica TaxID=2126181 RepID=A0A8H6WCH3_9AGAR|nr:MFS domain-containing protein [Mycena indigotica]KAF7309753.1 MFS domain-containing protein [Mycena indigotica]
MLLPFFYVLVLAWAAVASTVTLAFPIDNQRPLIARVGQPYIWSFSPSTFKSDGNIAYTVSTLPKWLAFDPQKRSFSGIPTTTDEGNLEVTITAHDTTSSASSTFSICISSFPPPKVNIPLASQFDARNPSMSSVFPVPPDSALTTTHPALRIPRQWSFSIGFRYDTLTGSDRIRYMVLQADGSDLPDWMTFREESLTVNGVVPHDVEEAQTLSLSLFGSDQEGYSAVVLPFDIITATHELVQRQYIPTINVSSENPFTAKVDSQDDFAGLLVDGKGIEPANISSLAIDTSALNWLEFDQASRVLSGNPPAAYAGQTYTLPLTVSAFNQTLHTNCSLAIVPSFFSTATIPAQVLSATRIVNFSLAPYFSNSTNDQSGDINLSSAFDTPEGNCLSFDPNSSILSGTIPDDISVLHIDITFTAFSRRTHSTSHTFLRLSIPPSTKTKDKAYVNPGNLSAAAHRKLTLALAIVFGIIGTVCALGLFFSAFQRCAKVDDGARVDQEAWSESDKRWYGLPAAEKGYGSSLPRNAMELDNPFGDGAELVTPTRAAPDYGGIGLGLRRVMERSGSDPVSTPSSAQSPGVMRKRDFLTRIRQTARNISDKYDSWRKGPVQRPVISKPTLAVTALDGLPETMSHSPSNPFDDANIISYPGSIVITNSPSTSTGDHSIPRRRSDFCPLPPATHAYNGLVRQLSSGSISSAEEGTIHVASKTPSIHSALSKRPRLVPFTSATRVPMPRTPPEEEDPSGSPSRRVPSQKAVVLKESVRNSAADELSVGIHYVRTLGGDQDGQMTPTTSTHGRSSFSSPESSHLVHEPSSNMLKAVQIRVGETFKLPVAVPDYVATRKLEAKMIPGRTWPDFLQVDLNAHKHGDEVELYGCPAMRHVGEYRIGIYTVEDHSCVSRVDLRIVA